MKTIKQYNQPGGYRELIKLGKVGANREWVGVVRAEEKGDYKLNIVVEHKESETRSQVVVRAIAKNGARVSLSGMIKIPKGVKEIDSQLELRILLLDDKSSGMVDPQLEIESDEVRVGHSASVSKINENQVRYLMSRGISKTEAESEIMEGWLSDIMI
ncbi:MAG: hypothetical protein DRP47_11485 [Candidatus Zixiibacteriota bacterium]|nr:MAG: hypothetical protein DRP47_11485 [candidate division Zixibacteria bacterium]